MEAYWHILRDTFTGGWQWMGEQIMKPGWNNYFYGLIILSLFFWLLEIVMPWRKKQPKIRKDFWLDGFYMFFNMFLFGLVGFTAVSNVFAEAFNDFLGLFGITNTVAVNIAATPVWVQFVILFLVKDFTHWNVHRLLHRVPWLWEFHKLHHSVEQMGFAAHLRFHWMESVVYQTITYIPLMMIGFGLQEFFAANMLAVAIGHFNHANIKVPLGPLKYLFNNPQMHIWHHAKQLPKDKQYGVNFGISLSIWDYLFGTHYIPAEGRDIELGFDHDEEYPRRFLAQILYPFIKKRTATRERTRKDNTSGTGA